MVLDSLHFETKWQELEVWLPQKMWINFSWQVLVGVQKALLSFFLWSVNAYLRVQHSFQVFADVLVSSSYTNPCELFHVLIHSSKMVVVLLYRHKLELEHLLFIFCLSFSSQAENAALEIAYVMRAI